jgi:exosortase
MNKSRLLAEFSVLSAIPIVVGWQSLARTFALAWHDDQYTHILLILPVAIALIVLDAQDGRSGVSRSPRAGAALFLAALLVAGASRRWASGLPSDAVLSMSMLAIVLWWVGAFVFTFGTRVSQRVLFPLCFLFWLVPFPTVVLDAIIRVLQQGSAVSARLLFWIGGIPVSQDGLMLSIPGLTVEVAKECSSIRSSLMLLVTTMVLAHLLLRSNWRQMFVIALAVPLSVAKNGLRIFTISMLATRVDPSFLNGRLHREGGVVFFAIAVGIIFLFMAILKRKDDEIPPRNSLQPVVSVLS